MTRVLLVLAILALAGCASKGADAPPSPTTSAASPPPASPNLSPSPANASANASRVVEQAFDLTASMQRPSSPAPADPLPQPKPNCVFVSLAEGARVVKGEATATWTPAASGASKLRLAAGAGSGGETKTAQGESGLRVDVPPLVRRNAPFVAIDMPSDGSAAPVDQPVRLVLRLEVVGEVSFSPTGTCHPSSFP